MDEKKLGILMDRMEIQDRIYLYCELVDTKCFDRIGEVFTPDALIDYRTCGSIMGSPAELIKALKRDFRHFTASQHIVTNLMIDVDGDTARSKHYLYNPMSWQGKDKVQQTMLFGSRYEGEWLRTPEGWKLTKFVQIKNYRLEPLKNSAM